MLPFLKVAGNDRNVRRDRHENRAPFEGSGAFLMLNAAFGKDGDEIALLQVFFRDLHRLDIGDLAVHSNATGSAEQPAPERIFHDELGDQEKHPPPPKGRADDEGVVQREMVRLKNVFYIGKFIWAGQLYDGKHKAIIDKKLFYRVQDMFKKTDKPVQNDKNFTYSKFIRCADCKRVLTAEI